MFKKPEYSTLLSRLQEPSGLIQVISGPRQVGKTTMVHQVLESLATEGREVMYSSADLPAPKGTTWIEEKWAAARVVAKKNKTVLALDEVQKIPQWSETVKRLRDEELRLPNPISVVILGSSALLMHRGLTESLAGRFEVIRMGHWSLEEMHKAFGLNLEQYLVYGGYPGGAALMHDFDRWRSYILDSLIETCIARDILMMTRVDKPILLRKLFMLACEYPCRILSYNKILGQLQDTGNTTTLAHYLDLLEQAGLVAGLKKYSGSKVRKRSSGPKLLPLNTALVSAVNNTDPEYVSNNPSYRGRLVETAVGNHLYQSALKKRKNVPMYWNAGDNEVDFVLNRREKLLGLEAYSGIRGHTNIGMEQFKKKYPEAEVILIGGDGLPIETALQEDFQ